MDCWSMVPERFDPAIRGSEVNKDWLKTQGYDRARYNSLEAWERTNLRTQAKGGLEPDSILSQLPGAITSTVRGYKDSAVQAATATSRTIRWAVVGAVAVAVAVLALKFAPRKAAA